MVSLQLSLLASYSPLNTSLIGQGSMSSTFQTFWGLKYMWTTLTPTHSSWQVMLQNKERKKRGSSIQRVTSLEGLSSTPSTSCSSCPLPSLVVTTQCLLLDDKDMRKKRELLNFWCWLCCYWCFFFFTFPSSCPLVFRWQSFSCFAAGQDTGLEEGSKGREFHDLFSSVVINNALSLHEEKRSRERTSFEAGEEISYCIRKKRLSSQETGHYRKMLHEQHFEHDLSFLLKLFSSQYSSSLSYLLIRVKEDKVMSSPPSTAISIESPSWLSWNHQEERHLYLPWYFSCEVDNNYSCITFLNEVREGIGQSQLLFPHCVFPHWLQHKRHEEKSGRKNSMSHLASKAMNTHQCNTCITTKRHQK